MKKTTKKPLRITMSLLFSSIVLLSACKKDNDLTPNEPNPIPIIELPDPIVNPDPDPDPDPQMSVIDLLSQEWELYETWQNGSNTTSGDNSKFQFTKGGSFQWENNNAWTEIAAYVFTADSSAINVLFVGTIDPVLQKLDRLDQDELHTTFTTNGDNYIYKYRR